ncbi:MAG: Conserved repeat protein, partial [Jatrophihabitans sp.]|nr:Conserved repeat protein [Jatrophihabitans sp.]
AVLSGATASQSPNFSAAAVNFNTPGGDGYSVEGFGNNIYTVFHHSAAATVFCATLTNQVCPGWPAHSTFVDPTAGTPLGQGTAGVYTTALTNGSFIANGRLYWPVSQNGATGVDPFGIQCLDLTANVSCGYNQLGTTTVAGYALSGDGIAAADGNYYYLDLNGFLQCVTATGTSCGAVDISGGPIAAPGSREVGTYGRYVFTSYQTAGSIEHLACFDTANSILCPGFPKVVGAPGPNYDSEVMPVVSSGGTLLGGCAVYTSACFSVTGTPIANPWSLTEYSFSPGVSGGFGTGVLVGTKYYTGHGSVVDCYDFAQPLAGGKVQPCAAFATHPPDLSSYTVRALANLPGCMASNGDGAQISIFNAVTGAPCASASQTLALDPSVYYCDGQPGHIDSWGAVSLPGLSASDYAGATLTLFGADGTALPAWTNVPFPASGPQSIDISSIPVTGNTAKLTAQVNLAAVYNSAAVNASRVRATWIGDPVQVCYQTTINPVPCLTTVPVSNTATAVTTAGAVTDGPAGNSSGPAIFNVSPSAAQCMLHLTKTAAPDPAKPGSTVTYTITVHNTGTMDYLASDPATFTDDITDVLKDSALAGNSLTSSAGAASFDLGTDVISWSGPLAANATATITYTVTVNDPDPGDHSMFNRVVTPPGTPSNCAAASTDPVCGAVVQVPDLKVSKSSNPADGATVVAGQVVTYTLTFQNVGQGTAATDYTDDLTQVLDDGSVTNAPTASNPNLTASAISNGTFTVTGGVPAGATYTVTYQVTVGPDGQRGDNDMVNFLFPTGSTPPTSCVSGDPLCTEHKIPDVSVAKTSSPVDGASVASGEVISYTLTFQNTGKATGDLDYVDHLAGVVDDATITTAASASNPDVTVGAVSNDQLPIGGTIPAGATYTVTYKVTVKPYAQQGDHSLLNYVAKPGEDPP